MGLDSLSKTLLRNPSTDKTCRGNSRHRKNKNTMAVSLNHLLLLLLVLLTPTVIVPWQVVSAADNSSNNQTSALASSGGVGGGAATASKDIDVVSTISNIDATTTSSPAPPTAPSGGESAKAVSGYGIAQTLDFAAAAATDQPEETEASDEAVIHSSSSSSSAGISNGHQNGMLLMAMLLDNKTNIESKDTKPALALFDFNPEDIQDLDGNDFYAVVGASNVTEKDNQVDATAEKQAIKMSPLAKEETDSIDDSLWTLPENPLTMPLVMMTNGQALPGAAMSGVADAAAVEGAEGEGDNGNIFKVKLKRRQEAKKRERHFSISSRMNVLGNEMTTIAQFQTLISMFDHWLWNEEAIEDHVTKTCGQDMSSYLTSLRAGELWALKVADSSGRYRGQFMFGNIFWMGSKEFCLDVNYYNLVAKANATKNRKLLPDMNYVTTTLKLDLYSLMNKTKIIQVGQCLPESCTTTDAENILSVDPAFLKFNQQSKEVEDVKKEGSIAMVNSRKVPGPYSLWDDRRFQILAIATCVICAIVVIATILEVKIDSDDAKCKTKNSTNNNNHNNGIPMRETTKNGNSNGDTQITVSSSEYAAKGFKDAHDIMKESEITSSGRKCPSEHNIFTKFLLCFSLISNGKAIMCLKTPSKDSLTSIHGIRLFSLLWTIMVHTYLQFFALSENRYGRIIAERSFGYQMIGNASFAVDTFFFLSGLLVALLFLRKGERASRQKSIFAFIGKGSMRATMMFIYRYLRLTPVYLVAIIANELSLKHTYNQSVFSPSIYDHVTCHHYWWRNILYINNWYPFQELCMIWSWYLANDMQFYLMAIFLLILSTRFMKTSVVISMIVLFASIVASAVISLKYNYMYKVADPFEAFDILYDKPWLRVGPYLMGMIGGFILSKWAKAPKISTMLNLTLWICSVVVQFMLVFGTWDGVLSIPKTAIYVSVGHTAWGMSLMWMVMSCYWGLAPPINKLLSYRAFLPLSRLTYCTYLLHPMIMVITSFRMEAPFHLQHVLILTAFLGNAIIAFLVALVASLLYEAPVIRILKLIFRK